MSRFIRALVACALALTAVFGTAAVAVAAPTSLESLDMVVHRNDDGSSTLIVVGTLPESVKLPATIKLAVPKGSQLQWAGEILGGPAEKDPQVKHSVSTADGSDVYSFPLTTSRTGQLEVEAPATSAQQGGAVDFAVPAAMPAKQATIMVQVPQGAQVTKPVTGATIQPGPSGSSYYTLASKGGVKTGQKLSISTAYSGGVAAGSAQAAPKTGGLKSSSDTAVLAIVVIAALGGLALVAFGVRRKLAEKQQPTASERVQDNINAARVSAQRSGESKRREAPEPEALSDAAARRSKGTARWVIVGAVAVALVAGALVATKTSTTARSAGDMLTRDFGGNDACTVSTFALAPKGQANLVDDSSAIFKALEGAPSLGRVALDVKNSTVEVNYCESSNSPEQIAQLISNAGWEVNIANTGAASPAQ